MCVCVFAGSCVNSEDADTADTGAAAGGDVVGVTDAGKWSHSLQSAAVERRDVVAEPVAACIKLSDQPTDLGSSRQSRLDSPEEEAEVVSKSKSEICIAQVLASLSVDPQVPATSSYLFTGQKLSPIRSRKTSARRNARNNRVSKSRDAVAEANNNDKTVGLSTINMSDIGELCVPLSSGAVASADSVPVSTAADMMSPSFQSHPVVSSISAESPKSAYHRPMKQSSEFTITYDETSRRYVQTVRKSKSTDRRKSMGFPGYQSNAVGSSCCRTLPIAVAINGCAGIGESGAANAVGGNRRGRLSLKKENAVLESSPLIANDEPTCDLSSMELVARICLGGSPSRTTEKPLEPLCADSAAEDKVAFKKERKTRTPSLPAERLLKSSATDSEPVLAARSSSSAGTRSDKKMEMYPVVELSKPAERSPSWSVEELLDHSHTGTTAENKSASNKERKTRTSSLPAGKVSKSSSEPVLPARSSSSARTKSDKKVDPAAPQLPGGSCGDGATKTGRKGKKSDETGEKKPTRARAAGKRSEKVAASRTSPRKSGVTPSPLSDPLPTTSTENNTTKKRGGGRATARKPPKAVSEKEDRLRGAEKPTKTKNDDKTVELSAVNTSAKTVGEKAGARRKRAAKKNATDPVGSPSKSPGRSDKPTAASAKRKRQSSLRKSRAETFKEPAPKTVAPLPSIGCLLPAAAENRKNEDAGQRGTLADQAVVDTSASMNGRKTADVSSEQNNSEVVIVSVSFVVPSSVSEENNSACSQSQSIASALSATKDASVCEYTGETTDVCPLRNNPGVFIPSDSSVAPSVPEGNNDTSAESQSVIPNIGTVGGLVLQESVDRLSPKVDALRETAATSSSGCPVTLNGGIPVTAAPMSSVGLSESEENNTVSGQPQSAVPNVSTVDVPPSEETVDYLPPACDTFPEIAAAAASSDCPVTSDTAVLSPSSSSDAAAAVSSDGCATLGDADSVTVGNVQRQESADDAACSSEMPSSSVLDSAPLSGECIVVISNKSVHLYSP